MTDLSVIIPSKNESGTIKDCIVRVLQTCPEAEVVIVDGGSDQTFEMIQKLELKNIQYIASPLDRGKGDALQKGIQYSTGDILVQIDADLQFFPEEIPLLLGPIRENKLDMVLGSRFLNGYGEDFSLRTLGNYCVSRWVSFLYHHPITDALAGFKAWRREVTQSFKLTSYTYSYEVELFARALQKKWRVGEVLIKTQPRIYGESTVSVVSAGWNILKDAYLFKK